MATPRGQTPIPFSTERASVEIEDVHVGGILWIRRRRAISSNDSEPPPEPNSYNHPAVVVRLKKLEVGEPLVTIAPVSIQTSPLGAAMSNKIVFTLDDVLWISRSRREPSQ